MLDQEVLKIEDTKMPNYGNISPLAIRHNHREVIEVEEEEEDNGEVDNINDKAPKLDEEESMEVENRVEDVNIVDTPIKLQEENIDVEDQGG